MNILYVTSGLGMGGIERMLLSTIPYLRQRGLINIHILCTTSGILEVEFKKMGVIIHQKTNNANPVSQILEVKSLHQKFDYQIINSSFGHTSGLLALACYLLKVPLFVSVHNQRAMFKTEWISNRILNSLRQLYLSIHKYLTIKFASKIIGHSRTNLVYFDKNWQNSEKYIAVKNGVDFVELNERSDLDVGKKNTFDKFIFGSNVNFIHVGSFKHQKNHEFLIKIFASLQPNQNNYKLILLGSGELMSQIEKMVKALKIENCVLFVGVEVNISYYLSNSNIFIFPSLYEGFGNVLIEAQFKNLPILASKISPHYESTVECYHPYFFDPTDEKDAHDKAVLLISELKLPKIQDYIHQGYCFASKHTIENMTLEIVDVYYNVLKDDY